MSSVFVYLPTASPNRNRVPLLERNEQHVGVALMNLMENVGEYLLNGQTNMAGIKILGLYAAQYPPVVILLCFNPQPDNPESFSLLPNTAHPLTEEPVMRITLPSAFRSCRIAAAYINDEVFPDNWHELTRERILKSLWTGVSQMWNTYPPAMQPIARVEEALKQAPAFHKRTVLHRYQVRIYDRRNANGLSLAQMTIPFASSYSTNRAKILLYMNKDDLVLPAFLALARQAERESVAVIMLDDPGHTLSPVLNNIATVDGHALIELQEHSNLEVILERRDFFEADKLRYYRIDAYTRELSWTLPLSFAEEHITKEEFEAAIMFLMECKLCNDHYPVRLHKEHRHEKLLYHQATIIGRSLRPDEYPTGFRKITWFDWHSGKILCDEDIPGSTYHRYTHTFYLNTD